MTGKELADIRRVLCGTDTATFGRALGLGGTDESVSASVRRLETANRVPEWYAKLATIYSENPKVWRTYSRSERQMKRYLLFGYCQYYPAGGSDDVQGDFDTLEEAKACAEREWWDFAEVLDLVQRKWINLTDRLGK